MAYQLTDKEMKDASDIAVRFWEPRKTWPAAQQRESLLREARRLHDQASQVARGQCGGLPWVWRFTASMLAIQAKHLSA